MKAALGKVGSIELRTADPGDKEFAYQVKKAAFREYVEQGWGWDEDEQRGLHDRRFRAEEFHIVMLGDVDIGVLCSVIEPDCVYVYQLYIQPAHQGQGIGGASMLAVIRKANELGLPVRLRVLKVNPRAAALYGRLGFALTGDTDTHVLMERSPGTVPPTTPG